MNEMRWTMSWSEGHPGGEAYISVTVVRNEVRQEFRQSVHADSLAKVDVRGALGVALIELSHSLKRAHKDGGPLLGKVAGGRCIVQEVPSTGFYGESPPPLTTPLTIEDDDVGF